MGREVLDHGSDRDDVKWNFDPDVTVALWSHVSHADAADLLDGLNNRFVSVTTRRSSFDAPASGPQEIAVTIIVGLATNAVWQVFFSELADTAGHRIRSAMQRLLPEATRNRNGREFIPVAIQCGKAQLNLESSMTEADISDAMASARDAEGAMAESLSGDRPSATDALDQYVWDSDSKLWVPGYPRTGKE